MSYPGQDTPGLKYVQRVYVHPDYDKKTGKNNIALIHLTVAFGIEKAKGKINSICLEKEQNLNKTDQLLISGWGLLSEDHQIEPKLQVIQADLIPSDNTDVLLVAQRLNDPTDRCQVNNFFLIKNCITIIRITG